MPIPVAGIISFFAGRVAKIGAVSDVTAVIANKVRMGEA
jgi:hypothetical protein